MATLTVGNLVDLKSGQVSREIFVNEQIYQQEQEQVFAHAWLLVGHESQIPKPGDYYVSSMGEESVIVAKDRENMIHVFLNSCRHRGMRVCRYDEGNTPVFTCPYHGWSYSTDGKLVGVPHFKDAYHESLDKDKWGLVEVAKMCIYKGTIWATWDGQAPPFLEYIGGFKLYLDLLLDGWDGTEGGTEVFGGIEKWRIPSTGSLEPKTSLETGTMVSATVRWTWWGSAQAAREDATPTNGSAPKPWTPLSQKGATGPSYF